MNRRNTTKHPRTHAPLLAVIEHLESRAMLAGVGPESWSAPGLAPAPLGTGVLSSSGIILTCSSPAPGSSGTASPPAPPSGSGTTSGGDLWDFFSAGSGAGGSASGSAGGVSTVGPALSSQYTGGSVVGGQGNGTVGTLSSADLWGMYWSGAGAGSSSSGSDEGSLADDPTISSQYTGGSGIGSITPLVYNPESDGPPVFHSGVFTGDHGSVQFVQTADTGNQGTGEGDASESDGKSRARSWWGLRGWFLGDEPIDDGGVPQIESEPKPRTLWQWFWGDDPIKGSLWKLGPSRISRLGDRPTHNDDKSAVESLEDGGKLVKELIEGAERDAALAALGAVVGKLGAPKTIGEINLKGTMKGYGMTLADEGKFFGWKPSSVSKSATDFTKEQLLGRGWTKERLLEIAEKYEWLHKLTPGSGNPSAAGRAAQLREILEKLF